jgi:hypothetical protein
LIVSATSSTTSQIAVEYPPILRAVGVENFDDKPVISTSQILRIICISYSACSRLAGSGVVLAALQGWPHCTERSNRIGLVFR